MTRALAGRGIDIVHMKQAIGSPLDAYQSQFVTLE
jgi:hypothetical protein